MSMLKKILSWREHFSSIWYLPLVIPYAIYDLLTRRCYYVTGTFLRKYDDKRMFFKTIFFTSMNRLPIKNMEEHLSKQMDGDVIILFFNRIPWRMGKLAGEKQDVNILFDDLES